MKAAAKWTYDIRMEPAACCAQQNRDNAPAPQLSRRKFAPCERNLVTNGPVTRLFMSDACKHRPWGTRPMPTTNPDDDRPRRGRHLARPPTSPHRPAHGHRQPLRLLAAHLTPLDTDHHRQAVDALAVLLAEEHDNDDDHGGDAE